jgi:hypothetical protein
MSRGMLNNPVGSAQAKLVRNAPPAVYQVSVHIQHRKIRQEDLWLMLRIRPACRAAGFRKRLTVSADMHHDHKFSPALAGSNARPSKRSLVVKVGLVHHQHKVALVRNAQRHSNR